MRKAAKVSIIAVPIAAVLIIFLLPIIQQYEAPDAAHSCVTPCQAILFGGYPAWVSPGYAYLGFGAVYVANVDGTSHLYCWHEGDPNLTDSPGHPSYICGVPMEWDTVPPSLWPGVPTMSIDAD
jgi:hypothetical protein